MINDLLKSPELVHTVFNHLSIQEMKVFFKNIDNNLCKTCIKIDEEKEDRDEND